MGLSNKPRKPYLCCLLMSRRLLKMFVFSYSRSNRVFSWLTLTYLDSRPKTKQMFSNDQLSCTKYYYISIEIFLIVVQNATQGYNVYFVTIAPTLVANISYKLLVIPIFVIWTNICTISFMNFLFIGNLNVLVDLILTYNNLSFFFCDKVNMY